MEVTKSEFSARSDDLTRELNLGVAMAHEFRAEAANAERSCAVEGQKLIAAKRQYAQECQGLQQQAMWATQEAHETSAMESNALRNQVHQLEARLSSQAVKENAIQTEQREVIAEEIKRLSEAQHAFARKEWAEGDNAQR